MKVLETRTRDGLKTRRIELPDGRRTLTIELPATVVRALGMGKVKAELAKWQRGEVIRARKARMVQLIREGVKPTAIADELGVTEQAVRERRKKLNAAA